LFTEKRITKITSKKNLAILLQKSYISIVKKTLITIFGFLFCIPTTFASVESLQIVTFNWDETLKKLIPSTFGSGTAIDKNLVLTNKHVISPPKGKIADFILLCPAQHKSTRSVKCDIPAVVLSVHNKFDAALIKPISTKVFLPHVRTTSRLRGNRVRLEGFPVPIDNLQNFGDRRTFNQIQNWIKNGGTLKIGGDKLTISRGKITGSGVLQSTGGRYLFTDAKVNFGNSGGAAFDASGNYIGIPTLKDKNFNALILTYDQLIGWVIRNRSKKPEISPDIQDFYEKISKPKRKIRRQLNIKTTTRMLKKGRKVYRRRTRSSVKKQKSIKPSYRSFYRSRAYRRTYRTRKK